MKIKLNESKKIHNANIMLHKKNYYLCYINEPYIPYN